MYVLYARNEIGPYSYWVNLCSVCVEGSTSVMQNIKIHLHEYQAELIFEIDSTRAPCYRIAFNTEEDVTAFKLKWS